MVAFLPTHAVGRVAAFGAQMSTCSEIGSVRIAGADGEALGIGAVGPSFLEARGIKIRTQGGRGQNEAERGLARCPNLRRVAACQATAVAKTTLANAAKPL